MSKKGRRRNVYFRQTPKSFRASKYTSVFYHIRTNLPMTINRMSKKVFNDNVQRLKNVKLRKPPTLKKY